MIRWHIDPKPDGFCALTLQDGETGDGFMMVFRNVGQLVETLEQIVGQARGTVKPRCTFAGMSAFVKEFPERF